MSRVGDTVPPKRLILSDGSGDTITQCRRYVTNSPSALHGASWPMATLHFATHLVQVLGAAQVWVRALTLPQWLDFALGRFDARESSQSPSSPLKKCIVGENPKFPPIVGAHGRAPVLGVAPAAVRRGGLRFLRRGRRSHTSSTACQKLQQRHHAHQTVILPASLSAPGASQASPTQPIDCLRYGAQSPTACSLSDSPIASNHSRRSASRDLP